MKLGHFSKCLILALLIGFGATAKAALAPTYFGWNYIGIAGDSTGVFPEAYLRKVTYESFSGIQTFKLPDFPLHSPNFGMPDESGLVNAPTYTTVPGGDGETTRTMGATVPIDWTATASGIPDILIREFTFDIPALSLTGITANFGPSHSTWYHLD